MWVDRNTFYGVQGELTLRQHESATLREQNKILETNLNWMRVRVNQLEKERAQLLYHITEIKIPVPEIKIPEMPRSGDVFNALPSFEDMGDEEAKAEGIRHAPDGTLLYKD